MDTKPGEKSIPPGSIALHTQAFSPKTDVFVVGLDVFPKLNFLLVDFQTEVDMEIDRGLDTTRLNVSESSNIEDLKGLVSIREPCLLGA